MSENNNKIGKKKVAGNKQKEGIKIEQNGLNLTISEPKKNKTKEEKK